MDCGIENSILSMLSFLILIIELCLFMKKDVPMLRKYTLNCLGERDQVSPIYPQIVQEKIVHVCVCVCINIHIYVEGERMINGQNINN